MDKNTGRILCAECGAACRDRAKFCGACGAKIISVKSREKTTRRAKTTKRPKTAKRTTSDLSRFRAAASVARAKIEGAELKWQVVVGEALPAFAPKLPSASSAAIHAQKKARVSLRAPVWSLAFASSLEMTVAGFLSDKTALDTASFRIVFTVLILFAGLIAGSRRGFWSKVTALFAVVLVLFQGPSIAALAGNVLLAKTGAGAHLFTLPTQVFALFATLRTLWAVRK